MCTNKYINIIIFIIKYVPTCSHIVVVGTILITEVSLTVAYCLLLG